MDIAFQDIAAAVIFGNQIAPVPGPCVPEAELASLKGDGAVPHYLPGENPFVNDLTTMYNIPVEAVLGGAETMYPEYRKKLKDNYVLPPPVQAGAGARN